MTKTIGLHNSLADTINMSATIRPGWRANGSSPPRDASKCWDIYLSVSNVTNMLQWMTNREEFSSIKFIWELEATDRIFMIEEVALPYIFTMKTSSN